MGAVEFFPFWYCSSPYYKFVPGFMRMKKRMISTLCMDCNLQSAFESVDFSSVGISTPSFIVAFVCIRPRLSRLAAEEITHSLLCSVFTRQLNQLDESSDRIVWLLVALDHIVVQLIEKTLSLEKRFASARAARDNEEFCRKNFEFAFLMNVQSTLAKTDTFGTDTKCPFQRDVRLIKGQITGISKGRHQIQVSVLQRCPSYRGVR